MNENHFFKTFLVNSLLELPYARYGYGLRTRCSPVIMYGMTEVCTLPSAVWLCRNLDMDPYTRNVKQQLSTD